MKLLPGLLLCVSLSGCFGQYMMGDYRPPASGPAATIQMRTPQASGTVRSTVSGSSFCGKTWYLDRFKVEERGNAGSEMKIEAGKPIDISVGYNVAYAGPYCNIDFSFLPEKDAQYEVEIDSVGKYCYVRMFRIERQATQAVRVKEESFRQVFPDCSRR